MRHDMPLTIQLLLGRLRTLDADSDVVTLRASAGDAEVSRMRGGEIAKRAERLCSGLAQLGVEAGDRVATLCWNTQEHFECYLAVPSMGAVLHTLNNRLHPEQLRFIIDHAGDRVIVVDASLAGLLAEVCETGEGRPPSLEHCVVIGELAPDLFARLPGAVKFDSLIAEPPESGEYNPGTFRFPALDDRQAAALCYTSGTTGDPKGVLYSHRSVVLFTMSLLAADVMGISRHDRVMPVVPMFHANAWGMPFAAALAGSDLVLPSRHLDPASLGWLIEKERVTVTAGVPTVFSDLLRWADRNQPDLSSLRAVLCGGSAVPAGLIDGFARGHGVPVVQAWGMTEMSPVGAVSWPPPAASEPEELRLYRMSQGRPSPLVEMRLIGEDGEEVAWDGESTGELETRGPWVASGYFRDEDGDDKFRDGWLRTGDVAAISPEGLMRITDRAKDVIKSGGEWISSVELENELMGQTGVIEAAVIAMPDERWGERPLACVVLEAGAEVTPAGLAAALTGRVPKWWLPDAFAFIDEVPKTSVGKFDKKLLRARLASGDLALQPVA